jgi:hypothetical protein
MGRPPLGQRAMTGAQRQRKHAAKKKRAQALLVRSI